VLAAGWHVDVASAEYAAVGGGSYHWVLHDRGGTRWFATVDDLDTKFWLGDTRAAAFAGLRAAMHTAVALRHDAGLEFVLAPVPAIDGAAARSLDARYVVTLFPYVRGTSRAFGEVLPPGERRQLVEMLAALHSASPAASEPPSYQIAVPRRAVLETALRELDRPWQGGPYSEPATGSPDSWHRESQLLPTASRTTRTCFAPPTADG
jgi:spectinomycin phosphotransferase